MNAGDFDSSKVMDMQIDIVEEFEKTLDDIEKAFELLETENVPEKISYLKFLLKDLDDIFSGEYEKLRIRNFLLKRPE